MKEEPAALTVINGHRKLVEGERTVRSDTQQREEVLAICQRYQDKEQMPTNNTEQ